MGLRLPEEGRESKFLLRQYNLNSVPFFRRTEASRAVIPDDWKSRVKCEFGSDRLSQENEGANNPEVTLRDVVARLHRY